MLTVRITMEGGMIQDMQCPAGVRVVVHDYDVDGSEDGLCEDEDGNTYVEGIWGSMEGPGMTPHVVVVGTRYAMPSVVASAKRRPTCPTLRSLPRPT
jgi:sugar lactone lactonase YvrE